MGAGTDELTASPAQFGLGGAAYADTATGLVVAVTKNRFNPIEMNAFDRVYALAAAAFGH